MPVMVVTAPNVHRSGIRHPYDGTVHTVHTVYGRHPYDPQETRLTHLDESEENTMPGTHPWRCCPARYMLLRPVAYPAIALIGFVRK